MTLKLIVAACLALLCTIVGPPARADTPNTVLAEQYCVYQGGIVQERVATYGTNGGTPLTLAGKALFCHWTSKHDGSTINALLSTLIAKRPTLAALAYYAETPYNGSCHGSPGSCYCSQVGGTDLFGGINAAGGGWVLKTDGTDVLDTCIFPDQSSIDSYGLFYHSANIVRGKDLSTVLVFHNPY